VWGGTVGKVSYVIVPWYVPSLGFGVRLQIEAVQVINLVTRGERSAEAYGFSAEEGYVAPPDADGQSESSGTEAGDESVGEEASGGVEF